MKWTRYEFSFILFYLFLFIAFSPFFCPLFFFSFLYLSLPFFMTFPIISKKHRQRNFHLPNRHTAREYLSQNTRFVDVKIFRALHQGVNVFTALRSLRCVADLEQRKSIFSFFYSHLSPMEIKIYKPNFLPASRRFA